RLSTRKVYVVTRRLDAQLDPNRLAVAVPLSASSRILSAMTSIAGLWKVSPCSARRAIGQALR
ncbi:hypothetical protein, partial [Mycobacterium sp.]|uniref:hypothetical protein n=1 Tax=Mycobacterium sp. TaxID=1785 RepID=UPI003BAE5C58